MKLTKNFYSSNFLIFDFFDTNSQEAVIQLYNENVEIQANIQKLANNLQVLKDYLKKPITITSGYRPKFWELKRGRSGNSQHVFGKAADIKVKGIKPRKVANAIEHLINNGDMLQGGIGIYSTFVHYDFRGTKARW